MCCAQTKMQLACRAPARVRDDAWMRIIIITLHTHVRRRRGAASLHLHLTLRTARLPSAAAAPPRLASRGRRLVGWRRRLYRTVRLRYARPVGSHGCSIRNGGCSPRPRLRGGGPAPVTAMGDCGAPAGAAGSRPRPRASSTGAACARTSTGAAAGVPPLLVPPAAATRVDALAVEAEELVRGKYHQFLSTQVALGSLVRARVGVRGSDLACTGAGANALFGPLMAAHPTAAAGSAAVLHAGRKADHPHGCAIAPPLRGVGAARASQCQAHAQPYSRMAKRRAGVRLPRVRAVLLHPPRRAGLHSLAAALFLAVTVLHAVGFKARCARTHARRPLALC
jgi:hypothetical protein